MSMVETCFVAFVCLAHFVFIFKWKRNSDTNCVLKCVEFWKQNHDTGVSYKVLACQLES